MCKRLSYEDTFLVVLVVGLKKTPLFSLSVSCNAVDRIIIVSIKNITILENNSSCLCLVLHYTVNMPIY